MGDTHSDWRAGDLRQRWEAVLRRLHADGRYAPGRDDHHRYEIVDVGEDGADIIVHAFFKTGERYCCYDPVCNFGLGPNLDWSRLRRAMGEECIDHLNPVRILDWRVTVEAGSVFHSGSVDAQGKTTTAPLSYHVGPYCEPEEAEEGA